jgi:threonine/homoserine/homoserine lactone efflux protein
LTVPSLTTLALFGLATLILTATPGPGVLYVWARSLAQGRRAGFASMFGIEAGEVVWLAAAATGLAALLAASAAALTFVRFAGAAYLIVLGIQSWRKTEALVTPERAPLGMIFAQGLITQLLNPKVAVFFVALLPQFMNTSHPIAPQVAVLGSVYIAIALLVDTSYVMTAAAISQRFLKDRLAQKRVARFAAATYVGLGLAAAASGVKPAAAD